MNETAAPAHKTVFIVDDHPLLRRGLAALIESDAGLKVGGEAASRRAAIDAIRQDPPDLVIVDLTLEDSDGFELIKDLRVTHPQIPTLVLSMHGESVYAERVLRAGARGYLTKQQLDDTVLVAIHRLLAGETYLSSRLEARLANRYLGGRTLETDTPVETLSDRELQVFRLIGDGRGTRQIAATLHRSVKTIESHRERIKQKLGLSSAVELAHYAGRWVEAHSAR